MKTDRSTSLHLNLLKALDPLAPLLKGGEGSGPHPGPEQSNAADNAWDTRGRKGEEDKKGRGPKGDDKKGRKPKKVTAPAQKNPQKAIASDAETLRRSTEDPSLVKNLKLLTGDESGIGQTYRVEFKDGTKGIYKPTKGTGLQVGLGGTAPVLMGTTSDSFEGDQMAAIRKFKEVREEWTRAKDTQGNAYEIPAGKEPRLKYDEAEGAHVMKQTLTHADGFELDIKLTYDLKAGRGTIDTYEGDPGGDYGEVRDTLDKSILEKTREAAAYEISESLGFNIVPQVEFVDYGEGEGHVQAFVEGEDAELPDGTTKLFDHIYKRNPDVHRVAALDMIVGNTDRHLGNLRVGTDNRFYAIDNGLAFPENTYHDEFKSEVMAEIVNAGGDAVEIPSEVRAEIQALSEEKLREIMERHGFPDRDIDGAESRLEVLKKLKGWPTDEKYRDERNRFQPTLFMDEIKA